jgi:hypothetical protein
MNASRSTTSEGIGRAVARAREHRGWPIPMFRYLVERPSEDTAHAIEDFRRALEATDSEGVSVRTVSEVFEACRGEAP